MREHIQEIATRLVDDIQAHGDGRMDLLADFAEPLPAIVTAEMLGVPVEDQSEAKELVGDVRRDAGKFPA